MWEKCTLSEKIGQLFFPAAFIHDTDEGIRSIENLITHHQVGGLTFFYSRDSVETNFNPKAVAPAHGQSLAKLSALTQHYQQLSKYPLLFNIDAEWGLGMRISDFPAFPYPLSLAATADEQYIYEVGKAIGQELKAVGIHQNLAPVVDVNNNPKNPVIGYRAFGDCPEKVARYAKAYQDGMRAEGILGCLKHFPGHGDTDTDSHLELPILHKKKEALLKNELFPFQKLIEQGTDCIMTAHLALPAFSKNHKPASLSKEIVTNLLRKKMNFQGVIMTDALNMKSLTKSAPGQTEYQAICAGNDLLSFPAHIPQAIELIAKKLPEARIEASFRRIVGLKKKAGPAFTPTKRDTPEAKASEKNTASTQRPLRLTPQTHRPLRQVLAQKILTDLELTTNKENRTAAKSNQTAPGQSALLILLKETANSCWQNYSRLPKYALTTAAETEALSQALTKYAQIHAMLYVPSSKPIKNFGIPAFIPKFLEKIKENTELKLYIFGNPYCLDILPPTLLTRATLAYQDLPALEHAAMAHMEGKIEARGKLPISLLNCRPQKKTQSRQ